MADLEDPLRALGLDDYAYWLAGQNVRLGEPLYTGTVVGSFSAYFYPPPFAQAWAPLSLLDPRIVDWLWKGVMLVSIRYMAGTWLMSGIWMLYPGTLTEISMGNVTFPIAALTVAGLRGRAEGVLPATLVKFSAAAVVPFIWFCRPAARRGLMVGAAVAALVTVVSVLLAPGSWQAYVAALGTQSGMPLANHTIIHVLPTAGADFVLRLILAGLLVGLSIRLRSPHLAFLATIVALPTLWITRLTLLFALLTLEDDAWIKRLMRGRPARTAA